MADVLATDCFALTPTPADSQPIAAFLRLLNASPMEVGVAEEYVVLMGNARSAPPSIVRAIKLLTVAKARVSRTYASLRLDLG
jgi:hypothetical protein